MLDPGDGEPGDPINDGLGTGRFGQSKVMAQHAKNSRNGSKADARHKTLTVELRDVSGRLLYKAELPPA